MLKCANKSISPCNVKILNVMRSYEGVLNLEFFLSPEMYNQTFKKQTSLKTQISP